MPFLSPPETRDIDHGFLVNEENFFQGVQITLENAVHGHQVISLEDDGFPSKVSQAIQGNTVDPFHQSESFPLVNLPLDRHLSGRACVKMKMIRRRSAAFGSVVEDRPAGTKIRHELKKGIGMLGNRLAAVV